MKILFTGYFSWFGEEEGWVRALRELGHEVTVFNISESFKGMAGVVQHRLKAGPASDAANREFLRLLAEVDPDIALCYQTVHLYADTVKEARDRSRALLVSYNNDNVFGAFATPKRWRHFMRAIPYWNLHILFRGSDLAPYLDLGAENVMLLRHHYLPWLHRRLALSPAQMMHFGSDIGFFGHCERDVRLRQLSDLMRAVPAEYSIHGTGWKRHSIGRPWRGMDTSVYGGEDYVAALNATKIGLAFISHESVADTYTTRVFEIPACGTMMLCQRTDDMLTLYEEGKEADFFADSDELIEKARYYLSDETARQRVAAAGWERAHSSGYDIYSRMKEWLAVAAELM